MTNIAHAVQSMLEISTVASDFVGGTIIANRAKASLADMLTGGDSEG